MTSATALPAVTTSGRAAASLLHALSSRALSLQALPPQAPAQSLQAQSLQAQSSSGAAAASMSHGGMPPNARVLHGSDLPGPLSLHRLAHMGAVRRLDDSHAYLSEHDDTLYGRGALMASMAPRRMSVCAVTAAWVWLGGQFPKTIDILSTSHFRSLIFGRKIRVFNRNAPASHLTTVGSLRITTPARTACDIALLSDEESADLYANEMVCSLMETYEFRPADCLAILDENRFWQNSPRARRFFDLISYCF
ncbi:hypothetical protein [Bifidobacterium mongoliense]|uniref:Uncharacterized protein n=1 Tax=Bifidobacterium mongoliense TaxID=518643 RepID=A0A423UGD2_9BIFI|nr:hypothetical protein [Bifidobacterium mongoliense]ROT87778.1 hypothetical protein BMONG18_0318 [Bifidobacterium mongoliense]